MECPNIEWKIWKVGLSTNTYFIKWAILGLFFMYFLVFSYKQYNFHNK